MGTAGGSGFDSRSGIRRYVLRVNMYGICCNILAKAPLDCNNGIPDIYILHYGILLTFLSKATCNHSFTHSHTDVGVYYAG